LSLGFPVYGVEVERTKEDLEKLSIQESRAYTPETVREVLPSNPMKDPQQCEVTMPRGDKNKNGKRNTKTQIIGVVPESVLKA
jgi:hypothetical protein